MNLVWLSADPVVEGSIGVTDRIEGPRHFLAAGHDVLVITGGGAQDRFMPGIPTRIVPVRYVPLAAWMTLWPGVLSELRSLLYPPDAIVTDFGLLPPAMRWVADLRRPGPCRPSCSTSARIPWRPDAFSSPRSAPVSR
jgi:hypothetical protein